MNNLHNLQQYQQLLMQELGLCETSSPQHFNPAPQEESPFQKTIFRFVNIKFNKPTQAPAQKPKQATSTSSDRFYSAKKHNYNTFIRQIQQYKATSQVQQSFLKVGAHAIRKMDYATTIFGKDAKSFDDKIQLKKRIQLQKRVELSRKLRHQPVLQRKFDYSIDVPKKQAHKVLIVKRRKQKIDEFLGPILISDRCTIPRSQRATYTPKNTGKHQPIQDYMPYSKQTKRQPFVCGLGAKQQQNNERIKEKLTAYHDFIWKINYSNGLFVKPTEQEVVYKAYVGPGNNCNLIKSILKRRYWWTIAQKNEGCQFVWTQLKVASYHRAQPSSPVTQSVSHLRLQQISSNQNLPQIKQHSKIFNEKDLNEWKAHIKRNKKIQFVINQRTYRSRQIFINAKTLTRITSSQELLTHNHFQQNFSIGNKKALFYNMRRYYNLQGKDVFDALPLTFHISKGIQDPQFKLFQQVHATLQSKKKDEIKNIWIMKPGQCSNRGNGITVCHSLQQINQRLRARQRNSDGSLRTFIIQKYMQRPFLYKGRKFDIRHYLLLTCINGGIKAYWFPQGYIRTASAPFTLKKGAGPLIHLTNDAVQKKGDDYGKHQKGNKISYDKFQSYIAKLGFENNLFYDKVLPSMKQLAIQAVKSCFLTLDPKRRAHNFQLLGMDFMLDDKLKPWLIQINTNPCLELSSPLLQRIIPSLVQHTFRICVDPLFPPPQQWLSSKKLLVGEKPLEENPFELIFDEKTEGDEVRRLLGNDPGWEIGMGKLEQDAQEYQNDGIEEAQPKN